MAPGKGRDRRSDFAALTGDVAREHDPESEVPSEDEGGNADTDSDDAADDSRNHYVAVPKSKLRKPKEAVLGPQYRGSKISRGTMLMDEDEEEDNPFSKDFGDDDESDDENGLEGSEEDDDLEGSEEDEETDDTEVSGGENNQANGIQPAAIDREELRKAMAAEQSAVAATITAANKADAEKGRAVIQQRATFDALLNARIKLQKSLIATNSLVALDATEVEDLRTNQETAINKAESAALSLWTTLTKFRQELDVPRTGDKRKASHLSGSTSLNGMLKQLKAQEESAVSRRNATLQKWSMKSRGVSTLPQQSRLNNEQPATIVDVLNEHLASSDRLMKRARTPRSCAPVQLAKRITEDEHIYDDADFYGLLLKELLEAKSSVVATNVDLTNFSAMRREAKTRRTVDTKASKGRKLRYTVHEKLQNYCAPEDRTTWGERQVEELFSGLFGQSMGLSEDKAKVNEDEMAVDGDDLLLFKA